jgi:UDP-N-acetylglucosamine 2-epimerase (non-hydrolysing)
MKILIVFGTRPEAIKMASIIKALQKSSSFSFKICVTAQHREMLDQVLDLFQITPDYDLNIMKPGQELSDLVGTAIRKISSVINDFLPDMILVQGDTTTTLAAALAGFYKQVPIGHIEAGLRTGDLYSPWPEEGNRRLTTHIATLHFAPTSANRLNLIKEGINEADILITGNTVIDALQHIVNKIMTNREIETTIETRIKSMTRNDIFNSNYILVTGHRRENFGIGFLNICSALKTIALNHPNMNIIYPVHLNPNVMQPVHDILAGIKNIILIKPIDYLSFTYLMMKSWIILTDSGGIQEEAPALGKPVLVMRKKTERFEGVETGTVRLVGIDPQSITESVEELLHYDSIYERMSRAKNPYGNGNAGETIVNFLNKRYEKTSSR